MGRAIAMCALAAGLVWAAWSPAAPQPRIAPASSTGAVRLTGSRSGAVLTARALAPGGSASGTVTIANSGGGAGYVSLSSSDVRQVAGRYGGMLGDTLILDIADVTTPSVPRPVFSGRLSALRDLDLGVYNGGESRTYRFTVRFPDGGAPPSDTAGDNRFQASGVSLQFDWRAIDVPDAPGPTDSGGTTTPMLTPPGNQPLTLQTSKQGSVTTSESTRRCVSRRRFTIHLRAAAPLASATVTVDGRRVEVRHGKRLTALIDMRGGPKGRVTVRIVALTRSGRRLTGTRTYHACAPRRPSKRRPGL